MKKIIIAIIVIAVIVIGLYFLITNFTGQVDLDDQTNGTVDQTATTTLMNKPESVLGLSVSGNPIKAYHFGTGTDEVIFVGGIHGGYEWNTVLAVRDIKEYLQKNPTAVPANMKVTVIPVLNPDGLAKVVGTTTENFSLTDVSKSDATLTAGRFNGNNVDLNRNFDCDWQTNAKWQTKNVSGGVAVFSEPESQAVRDYILANSPKGVVVYYSAAGGVFASNCHNGTLPETTTLTDVYATASGYKAFKEFNFYETTGDMTNWLAKIGVPSISILLTNHTDVESSKNLAGALAVIKHFTK